METVSSAEFQRKIGHYPDRALVEDVFITRNGRKRLVMMSIEKYQRLKRRDREVLRIDDFTEADLEAIRKAESEFAKTFLPTLSYAGRRCRSIRCIIET